MKIAIIHSVSGQSAKYLKEYLEEAGHKASIFKPFDMYGTPDLTAYDWVVSLGCSAGVDHKENRRINNPVAVKQCIDKRLSFASFNRAGVKTLEWTTEVGKIPKTWDQVAVRKDACGRKAEDLEWYVLPLERDKLPRDAALYTRCHYGRSEYRLYVLCGRVVGRYLKVENGDGEIEMVLKPSRGFDVMDEHVIRAAKALNIDYAGFDIIAHNKKDFAILEANSGATLQHDVAVAFVDFFNPKV